MCELFHFFDRLYLYCIGVHETFNSVIPRTKVGEADLKREHPPGVLAGSIHGRAYGIQSVFFCCLENLRDRCIKADEGYGPDVKHSVPK